MLRVKDQLLVLDQVLDQVLLLLFDYLGLRFLLLLVLGRNQRQLVPWRQFLPIYLAYGRYLVVKAYFFLCHFIAPLVLVLRFGLALDFVGEMPGPVLVGFVELLVTDLHGVIVNQIASAARNLTLRHDFALIGFLHDVLTLNLVLGRGLDIGSDILDKDSGLIAVPRVEHLEIVQLLDVLVPVHLALVLHQVRRNQLGVH